MKKVLIKSGIFLLIMTVLFSVAVVAEGVYPEHSLTGPQIAKFARINIVYDNTDHGDHRTILENVVKVASIAENANVWLYPIAGKEAPILVQPTRECIDKLFSAYIKASNELKSENVISAALADLQNDTTATTKELVLFQDTQSRTASRDQIKEIEKAGTVEVSHYYTFGISINGSSDDDFFGVQMKKQGYATCEHSYDSDNGLVTINKGFGDRNIVVLAKKDKDNFTYNYDINIEEEYRKNASLFINGYMADKETYDSYSKKSSIKGVALSYNHINFVGVDRGSDKTVDTALAVFTADGVTLDPASEDIVIPLINAGTVQVYYKASPGAGICSAETEYNLKQVENIQVYTKDGVKNDADKNSQPTDIFGINKEEKEQIESASTFPMSSTTKEPVMSSTTKKTGWFSISKIIGTILGFILAIISLIWRLFWLGIFVFGIIILVNKKVRNNVHIKILGSRFGPAFERVHEWVLKQITSLTGVVSKVKGDADLNGKFVFISYASNDYKVPNNRIETLMRELESRNIKCWISAKGIKAGRDYSEVLPEVISKCKMVVLFISPASSQSEVVAMEISKAQNLHKQIVPVQITDFDLFKQSPKWEFILSHAQIAKAYSNKVDVIKKVADQIEELYNE